jgi:hypothetical protein
VLFALVRKVLVNRARQEQNDNDRRRDPHWAVQIRVSFQHIKEVGARVDSSCASAEDLSGVYIESLRVEGERPEEAFAGA